MRGRTRVFLAIQRRFIGSKITLISVNPTFTLMMTKRVQSLLTFALDDRLLLYAVTLLYLGLDCPHLE